MGLSERSNGRQADTALGHGALQRTPEKEPRFSQQNITMSIMHFTSITEHGHSTATSPAARADA